MLVRFVPLSANVLDVVTFRIKEEGAEKWFYENNYNANQFQPDEYFTFGFQTIKDSKDKVYVFEVESLAGTTGNGIGLSPKKPQAAVVSKYVGEDLKNINTLFSFFSKQVIRESSFPIVPFKTVFSSPVTIGGWGTFSD